MGATLRGARMPAQQSQYSRVRLTRWFLGSILLLLAQFALAVADEVPSAELAKQRLDTLKEQAVDESGELYQTYSEVQNLLAQGKAFEREANQYINGLEA